MKVAVIIAAYQTCAQWLDECIGSIEASAAQTSVTLDLRVGVDGCQQTATHLDDLITPYWWSPVNVGPYVMRNSLIALGLADAYVIFDADDVMHPQYFARVLRGLQAHVLVGTARTECTEQLVPLESRPYRHGVCAFRPYVLDHLGGYKGERVAADVDFIARASTSRIPVHFISEPCYLRRRHPGSLTNAATTGRGTRLREQARRRMEQQRRGAGARVYVTPVTTPLERRGQEAWTA